MPDETQIHAVGRPLLEALPSPSWLVDADTFAVLESNRSARVISQEQNLLRVFPQGLSDDLLARLKSDEPEISFRAILVPESAPWIISAALLAQDEASRRRLIFAQPAAQFEFPAEVNFDEMMDSAFDGMILLDTNLRILQISKRFQKMFGYAIEDLRGKTPDVLIPGGPVYEYELALHGQLDRGGEYHADGPRLRRDGTVLEVRISARTVESGRFRGCLVVIYRDMTEIQRSARHRNLQLEVTRILAQSESIEQATKDLLPTMCRLLEWKIARLWLMGEDGLQCEHSFYPEGFAAHCEFKKIDAECSLVSEVAQMGSALRLVGFRPALCPQRENCFLQGGSLVALPILDSSRQLLGVLEMRAMGDHQPESGRRELVEGICAHLGQFITRTRTEAALAENEAKFRTLADMAPIAIFIHRDGTILYANAACQTMSGYSPQELMSLDVWSLFHEEEQPQIRDRVRRRQMGEDFRKRWDARMVRKDGEVRWMDYSASRLIVDHHPAVLCAATDVTERRELEMQLRQTQKMEAVGRLAGGIAHDFNNLLMVIGCSSEMIRLREDVSEPVRKSVAEISQATDRAAALTRQLLAFSRRQVLAPKIIALDAVLKGTELILRRTLGDDIVLRFALDAAGPILADPSQIEQIVLNLAVNARDAMPDGGELSISTSALLAESILEQEGEPRARHYAVLSVRDTGMGMSQETQQHIFEPFFTTKNVGKGTGLGLSTVYGIVQQSGGFIQVESKLGVGSTFHIYLPVVEGEVVSATVAKEAESKTGAASILLVEDEEDVRSVLYETLLRDGHKVFEAASGNEALKVSASAGHIDLLITDVVMAEISGRELADQLLLRRPELKVLFVSGYNEDVVLQKGVVEGQMEFLQKPFTPTVLLRKVQELLARREES